MSKEGSVDAKLVRRNFRANLIACRLKKVWNQDQLASRSGLTGAAISHFETGKRLPCLINLIKLSKALNISIDFLVSTRLYIRKSGKIMLKCSSCERLVDILNPVVIPYTGKTADLCDDCHNKFIKEVDKIKGGSEKKYMGIVKKYTKGNV